MGLLNWLTAARPPERRVAPDWSGPLSLATPSLFGIDSSDAGVSVTPDSAMAATAVYACVRVISSAFAGLPFHFIDRANKERDDGHRLVEILNENPNPEMTGFAYKQAVMINALLHGAGYSYIQKDVTGRAAELYPLPGCTYPFRLPNGNLVYRGTTGGRGFELTPDQVFAVVGMSRDGISPISPVSQGVNAIGLALAMEKFGSKFFSNGGNLGAIVALPAAMKAPAVEAFKASWKANYSGPDNSFKTALLTDGMTYTKTGTDPKSAQMLDARVFQVREVARVYGVPLHMIGDLENATFSNIEHQGIEFQQQTIQPWAQRWEQEGNRKLLGEDERRVIETRANLDSLLRSDTAARYAAYNQGRQGGWLTVNDIRRKEGMPPVPGGDELLSPLNMTPVGSRKPAAEGDKQ
ncbi:MAG: phage portal protein [Phycisphaerales bacterium]|nr:phage portal protein [Phycisphaerales bacterium]